MTTNNSVLKQQSRLYHSYLKIKDNPRYKKAWAFITKNVPQKAKILDIGCANGDFSKKLIREGYDCYGLEFMSEAIRQSRKVGLKIQKGSFLEKFPYKSDYFDVVFAGEVIEHTIDDSAFLRQVYRILKPGGLLLLTTPNLVSLGNRILMLFGKLPRFAYADFHYRIYTSDLLVSKLKGANFKLLYLDSSYVLISTFYNILIGVLGELLGSILPTFGEHLIVYAQKKK